MQRSSLDIRPQAVLAANDYVLLARQHMDPSLWEYVTGSAADGAVAVNLRAFDSVGLRPGAFSETGRPDTGRPETGRPETAVKILGRTWATPVAVAPVAGQALIGVSGDIDTVRAAGAAGVPVVVSAFAGSTFEELASVATAPLWLEVPAFRNPAITRRLVERAERAGFDALVLTVDTSRAGRRSAAGRADIPIPPGFGPVNLGAVGLDTPAAIRAELGAHGGWSTVERLRAVSSLPVLVRGVSTAADGPRAIDAGAHGIVVTNPAASRRGDARGTLDVLPEVAAAVGGRCPVLLGGGIRRGADILASLALGADAVLLGRTVLCALAVHRRAGVARVLELVTDELAAAMTFTGARSVSDAGPSLVRVEGRSPARPAPAQRPAPVRRPAPVQRPAPVRGAAPRASGGSDLRKEDLHSSLSEPVLDAMNFLNEITLRYPKAISFAPGRPYDGSFATDQVFAQIRRYLDHLAAQGYSPRRIRDSLYQYGPTAGQIRELIAASLRDDENIDVAPESIVVTVGSQEAMLLALRALISGPDDVLLVSSPCYVGITGAARLLDVSMTAVEEQENGLSCARLEAAIQAERARDRRPRACYVVPDHANPSGTTMPMETRAELLALAARHDILILEDSPYRLVSPVSPLPTLKSLDRDRTVVHLGSYSKTLFPGARVGFVVADQRVVDDAGRTSLLADEIAKIKSMVTVNTSSLSQAVVAGSLLASDGRISRLNAPTAEHYGRTMSAVLHELDRHFPEARRAALGLRWNKPTGGFFLTMQVGFRADNVALARSAEEFDVIWTPMEYFYPDGGGHRRIRLSISYLTPAEIGEGIARLANFIESETTRR